MKHNLQQLVCLLVFCLSGAAQQPIEDRVREIIALSGGDIAAFAPKNVARLSGEEREILLRYYRGKVAALQGPEVEWFRRDFEMPQYSNKLLMLGDPETVAATVRRALAVDDKSAGADDALSDLARAAHPEAIPLLAPSMFAEEQFVLKMQGDIGGSPPRSFRVAVVISSILGSPSFSNEVHTWLKSQTGADTQRWRGVMRKWWNENERFFKEGNYKAVKPGDDIRTAELAAHKEIERRLKAYREALRAQGKNPADDGNWDEWRDQILPSLLAMSPEALAAGTVPATTASPAPQSGSSPSITVGPLIVASIAALVGALWLLIRRVWMRK